MKKRIDKRVSFFLIKMTTITLTSYIGFDKLSLEQATDVLYNKLIPQCEKKRVYLAQFGGCGGGIVSRERYEEYKARKECFDVKRVQEVFAWAQTAPLRIYSTYKRGSYGLKHEVEDLPGQRYTSNGDLIAAFLLCGHTARFPKGGKPNCDFKVAIKRK